MEALFRLMWQSFLSWPWLNGSRREIEKSKVVQKRNASKRALEKRKGFTESVEDLKTEMKVFLAKFSTFREKSDYKPLWNEYIFMVMLLLQFTKAERTGNWSLHLRATSEMIPFFSRWTDATM